VAQYTGCHPPACYTVPLPLQPLAPSQSSVIFWGQQAPDSPSFQILDPHRSLHLGCSAQEPSLHFLSARGLVTVEGGLRGLGTAYVGFLLVSCPRSFPSSAFPNLHVHGGSVHRSPPFDVSGVLSTETATYPSPACFSVGHLSSCLTV
jgi:hypothetical protein